MRLSESLRRVVPPVILFSGLSLAACSSGARENPIRKIVTDGNCVGKPGQQGTLELHDKERGPIDPASVTVRPPDGSRVDVNVDQKGGQVTITCILPITSSTTIHKD